MQPRVWTEQDVRALGVVTSVENAASVLGIGKTLAYDLIAAGKFPVRVIRAGSRCTVPVRPILQALGLEGEPVSALP